MEFPFYKAILYSYFIGFNRGKVGLITVDFFIEIEVA